MIKTVSLTDSVEDYKNKIPAGSIVLCPKCLWARCITDTDISSNGNGGLKGVSGDLVHGKTPFLVNDRHCPECRTNILWDGKFVGAGNVPYPPQRFQGTYIEPDTFISYVVGYLMLASQNDDPCGGMWHRWARRSS